VHFVATSRRTSSTRFRRDDGRGHVRRDEGLRAGAEFVREAAGRRLHVGEVARHRVVDRHRRGEKGERQGADDAPALEDRHRDGRGLARKRRVRVAMAGDVAVVAHALHGPVGLEHAVHRGTPLESLDAGAHVETRLVGHVCEVGVPGRALEQRHGVTRLVVAGGERCQRVGRISDHRLVSNMRDERHRPQHLVRQRDDVPPRRLDPIAVVPITDHRSPIDGDCTRSVTRSCSRVGSHSMSPSWISV